VRDLELTVDLFEAIRSYQQAYDPTAYFLTGWLPNPVEGEKRDITADFLRHPRTVENIALEAMLISAWQALRAQSFVETEEILDSVAQVLEEGSFAAPPATDYLALVEAVGAAGYEVQRIDLHDSHAHVLAIANWPELTTLTLHRTDSGWVLQ